MSAPHPDTSPQVPGSSLQAEKGTLRIGGRRFESNLLLCPIAGYCDLSFRLAVRSVGGLSLAYTDLVNPRALIEGSASAFRLAETCPEEQPIGVQLYGCNAEEMVVAAQWVEQQGPALIDINMGCPVPKIAGRGGGSGLMRNCSGAVHLAESVVKAVKLPVTVKMRLGWDETSLNAPQLARQLEDVGVAAVTVHGRTAEMKFSGKVRLPGIAEVVAAVKRIPVIGNGDVDSPEAAETMVRQTGCAGVMIGRAALSDPWLFRDSKARLNGEAAPPTPTAEERVAVMNKHFRHLVTRRGEKAAVTQFRQRFSWYATKLGSIPKLRETMRKLESSAQYEDVVGAFVDVRRADPTAVC